MSAVLSALYWVPRGAHFRQSLSEAGIIRMCSPSMPAISGCHDLKGTHGSDTGQLDTKSEALV